MFDALRTMGQTNHPRMPVYDAKRKMYIGAVTSRTVSRAVSRDHTDSPIFDYMIQPARVTGEDSLPAVIDKMQEAGTTIAFVYDGDRMVGMITLSDILERLLGIKV